MTRTIPKRITPRDIRTDAIRATLARIKRLSLTPSRPLARAA